MCNEFLYVFPFLNVCFFFRWCIHPIHRCSYTVNEYFYDSSMVLIRTWSGVSLLNSFCSSYETVWLLKEDDYANKATYTGKSKTCNRAMCIANSMVFMDPLVTRSLS